MEKNVLILTRIFGQGGTEKIILQQINSLKDEGYNIIVASGGGLNVKQLEKIDIKHINLIDLENKNPIFILKNFFILYKLISREKIEIVHTHHRMASFYATMLQWVLNFKFIHTAHNIFEDKKIFTNFCLTHANIIAVGEKVRQNLIHYFKLSDSKITVLCNTIDKFDGRIQTNESLDQFRNQGKKIIMNAGRLTEQKGFSYFIDAAAKVLEKESNIVFAIVGEGEDRLSLEHQVEKLNIKNNVIFLGYQKDIQNLMAQSDFIVISSLWEGFPLIPIEAFSVSKTVIGTDIDGTNEIISDNANGLLIPPKNYIELAKAISYLLENEDILEKLSINAKITYEKKYSYNSFKKNYINYYYNAIK